MSKALTVLRNNRSFILFVIVLFAVRWSFADHYRVPSGSMLPTIQIGDHILTNKMAYDIKVPFTGIRLMKMGDPQRGDIVVFTHPQDSGTTLVKRLIGLPGDELTIVNGFIFVNGQPVTGTQDGIEKLKENESHGREMITYTETLGQHTYTAQRTPGYIRPERLHFKVPADQFFFMGDNRDNSADSRVWGFAPRENLKGKATAVMMSVRLDGFVPKFATDRLGHVLN